jgi:hypothetical protein
VLRDELQVLCLDEATASAFTFVEPHDVRTTFPQGSPAVDLRRPALLPLRRSVFTRLAETADAVVVAASHRLVRPNHNGILLGHDLAEAFDERQPRRRVAQYG